MLDLKHRQPNIQHPTPDSRVLSDFNADKKENKRPVCMWNSKKYKYTSSKLYSTWQKSSQTIHSRCHTRLNHISTMSIYFYTFFLCLFACHFFSPLLLQIPLSMLCQPLFCCCCCCRRCLSHTILLFSLIFSLSFIHSCFDSISSFDVANWQKM